MPYVITCYESVLSRKETLCNHLWLRQSSFFPILLETLKEPLSKNTKITQKKYPETFLQVKKDTQNDFKYH